MGVKDAAPGHMQPPNTAAAKIRIMCRRIITMIVPAPEAPAGKGPDQRSEARNMSTMKLRRL
jgi:hypothetical protein